MCSVRLTNNNSEDFTAFSHVSIGSWWTSRHIIVSNSGFYSGLNIAPRSHPNDGEFDVVAISADMPLKQRFIARRKARTGTHIPHPSIAVTRGTTLTIFREKPQERLSIDGVAVSNWSEISITIQPDYWEVIL
jgi:diacylglycerol kinase family enzyme